MAVRQQHGYDGAGVGVAVIDSGVASWHEDLGGANGLRVSEFVDFVNGIETTCDDYGHGTHVAGIVAGNGFDSDGARAGIAPAAHLMVLKVLDAAGNGRISDVIAALDRVLARKDALNIRVVNLSVAAGVYESSDTDPLTLAAKRVVEAGVVVVAAAGNGGRNSEGLASMRRRDGAWERAVGPHRRRRQSPRHERCRGRHRRGVQLTRSGRDYQQRQAGYRRARRWDRVADHSGKRALHNSIRVPASGHVPTDYMPYMSLSGTSMSAPVVSGTIALMFQANPA